MAMSYLDFTHIFISLLVAHYILDTGLGFRLPFTIFHWFFQQSSVIGSFSVFELSLYRS